MNRYISLKPRLMAGLCLAWMLTVIAAIPFSLAAGAGGKAAKAPASKGSKPDRAGEKDKKKLTGAELYAIHCNRCHAERYATERTDAQWQTIMMHMQVRAQLPGKDARAVLKYLQENN